MGVDIIFAGRTDYALVGLRLDYEELKAKFGEDMYEQFDKFCENDYEEEFDDQTLRT